MIIERLTQNQKEKIAFYRDKWTAIGLSTQKADKKMAETGIKKAYEIAGLKCPKIIWTLSPLSSGLARYFVFKIIKNKKVCASVRESVCDSVWASVWDSVCASVRESVCDSVCESIRESACDSIRDSVCDSVCDSIRESACDSIRESVWDSIRDSVYGQHNAVWLGFYDYCRNELKLEKQTDKIIGLMMIAQSANWFLPHENICWISERHDVCKFKNGKIHSEKGPAIHYPDGFEIYALNGVRVPKNIVETPAEKIE